MSIKKITILATTCVSFATMLSGPVQADVFKEYAVRNAGEYAYMLEVFTRQTEWCEEALETGIPVPADRELIVKYPRDRPVELDPELLALSTEAAGARSDELLIAQTKARKRFYACFKKYREEFAE